MGGETLHVQERIVLAPVTGRFVAPDHEPGVALAVGGTVAGVVSSGELQVVTTPFAGVLAGLLAHDGERVREGQPVAWLRAAG